MKDKRCAMPIKNFLILSILYSGQSKEVSEIYQILLLEYEIEISLSGLYVVINKMKNDKLIYSCYVDEKKYVLTITQIGKEEFKETRKILEKVFSDKK